MCVAIWFDCGICLAPVLLHLPFGGFVFLTVAFPVGIFGLAARSRNYEWSLHWAVQLMITVRGGYRLFNDKCGRYVGTMTQRQSEVSIYKIPQAHNQRSNRRTLMVKVVHDWLDKHNITVLNVAGNSEQTSPGIAIGGSIFIPSIPDI